MFLECGHCGALIDPKVYSRGDAAWCSSCGGPFKPVVSGPVPRALKNASQAASAVTRVEAVGPPPPVGTQQAVTAHPRPVALPAVNCRPSVSLPPGMPPAVQALGDPEEVFPPDDRKVQFNRTLVHFLAGCVAALLLAVAFLMFLAFLRPFGTNRPPSVAFLAIGGGFALLALLTAAAGYWSTHSAWVLSRWGPRTYLVYPEVLAEVFPDHHRLIAWEKIGACQENHIVVAMYRFQVEGERSLAFDNTVSEHQRFAAQVARRAAGRRFLLSFGGESVLSELRGARRGPSIVVHELGLVGWVYRITFLGDRLLFYKVVNAAGLSPTPPPNVGGLVGAFAITAHTRARHKFLQEMRDLEHADVPALLEYAAGSDGSFAVSPADLPDLRLDPPSGTRQLLFGTGGTEHAGLLKLTHPVKGSMTLAVLSREDMATILEQWPRFLPQALRVNVEWSPSTAAFVARG